MKVKETKIFAKAYQKFYMIDTAENLKGHAFYHMKGKY